MGFKRWEIRTNKHKIGKYSKQFTINEPQKYQKQHAFLNPLYLADADKKIYFLPRNYKKDLEWLQEKYKVVI